MFYLVMSSMILFILFVCIIAVLFLFINLVFAPHNPYQEKDSMFECGFHSFLQSRSPFNILFFIYALVYLLLDLEILLTFPFAVSEYVNNIYGLIIIIGFVIIITIGFVYELGKGALKIPSKQHTSTSITPALQSSILPFNFTINKIRKHLTFNNIIRGLITVTIMAVIKNSGISEYIIDFLDLPVQESRELYEYGITGVIALIVRLGFRGIIEDLFPVNFATTGDGSNPLDPRGGIGGSAGGGSAGSGSESEGGSDSSNTKGKQVDTSKQVDKGKGKWEGKSFQEYRKKEDISSDEEFEDHRAFTRNSGKVGESSSASAPAPTPESDPRLAPGYLDPNMPREPWVKNSAWRGNPPKAVPMEERTPSSQTQKLSPELEESLLISRINKTIHFTNLFNKVAMQETEEFKKRITDAQEAKSDEEWKQKNKDLENQRELIAALDNAMVKETERLASLTIDENTPENTKEKRNNDTVDKDDNESGNENDRKKRK